MHHVHPDSGAFVIADGKYIWNHNADFPLFLKSMFEVNKQLLDGLEEAKQLFHASTLSGHLFLCLLSALFPSLRNIFYNVIPDFYKKCK